jgi:hypothetical protein
MFWGYSEPNAIMARIQADNYWDMMIRYIFALTALTLMLSKPCAAMSEGFAPITDKSDFVARIADRPLHIGMFDLSIVVKSDGAITGTALGWQVTGNWEWENNLFCREMDWGGMEISYNCQLIETNGEKVRFTSDAGQGRAASFTLN